MKEKEEQRLNMLKAEEEKLYIEKKNEIYMWNR